MKRTVLIVACLVLVAVIGYSFFLIGSPSYNRLLLQDNGRIDDFEKIDCAIRWYQFVKGKLPPDLGVLEVFVRSSRDDLKNRPLVQDCDWCSVGDAEDAGYFKDTTTGQYYEYTASGDSYNLCADFAASWEELEKSRFVNGDFSGYDRGRYCFERKVAKCNKV